MAARVSRGIWIWLAALVPFIVLCTANSAMYRYAASDEAFYIPAVLLDLQPAAFPRDAALIVSQARLTLVDETIAGLARWTGAGLPALFAVLYVTTLVLLAAAVWLIARRVYRTVWGAVALLTVLTLRHAIWRTGTNTLEGYFHPRQLAFAFGALGLAALLRRRVPAAAGALVLAAIVHPTTALWFGIWFGAAAAVMQPRWRRPLAGVCAAGLIAGMWALTVGPLAGRVARMDPEWVATLASKDYLFPLEWPLTAWMLNLLYVPVIVLLYRRRRALGLVDDPETGMVAGVLSLALVFAAILPANAARVALAVQLQPARMFWMLDFVAVIYVTWALAEGAAPREARAGLAAACLIVLSMARSVYLKGVLFPDRPLALIDIRDDDWGRAMAWARQTDLGSGWLADPMHAVHHGASLRAAAGRDVLVEAVKDAAVGLYDRRTAIRTRDRLQAVGDFGSLSAERARAIGATYDLDYLIAEREFPLPVAFESGAVRVYRLR
ncbi:MAG TPA: hypothetical protein VGI12_18395 [Vicinamibacterales bacterium]|jgi:hypothetical protein